MLSLTTSRWFAPLRSRSNRKARRTQGSKPLGVHLLEDRVVPAITFFESFANFDGTGFSPTPAPGQLDSNFWIVGGLSDGVMTYGDTKTTGDFARGASTVPVTSGGIFAFGSGATKSFGVQPTSGDFSPGDYTLRVQNDGSAAADPVISYNLFVNNDQDRGNSFNASYSLDGTNFTNLPTLDYVSPDAKDTAGYLNVGNKSVTINGVNLAPNDFFYLRWTSDDVSGTGSRDEFGINAVTITASSTMGATTMTDFPFDGIDPTTVTAGMPVTFKATVTSTTTPTGTVEFRDGGPTGTLLATATDAGSSTTATTRSYVVVSSTVPVGTYNSVNAYFLGGSGFNNSNTPAPFGATLTVNAALEAPINTGPFDATVTGGTSGFVTVAATGNPAPTFSLSGSTGSPVNASIDPFTGKLSFSPDPVVSQTMYTFAVVATNSEGFDTDTFTLTVNPVVPLQPFTPGNLVIYRIGDAMTTYGTSGTMGADRNAAAAAYLDEYTTAGVLVQSYPVPASVSNSIGSTSEGMLTLSADGRSITFGAYAAAPGSSTDVPATASNVTPRVLGTINAAGNIDVTTTTSSYSGGNIRSVATVNGKEFYTAGSNAGIRYFDAAGVPDAPGELVSKLGTSNMRTVEVTLGQLYYGTGGGGTGVTGIYNSATEDLPTALTGASPSDTLLTVNSPAISTSPYQFTVIDMDQSNTLTVGDRLYYVDDVASRSLSRSDYTISGWSTPTIGVVANLGNVRGLTGVRIDGTTAALYATQFANNFNDPNNVSFSTSLLILSDANVTPTTGMSWSSIADLSDAGSAAAAVQGFRGIAFVPEAIGTTPSVVTITSGTPSATEGTPVVLTATVTGGTPADYVTIMNDLGQALFTGQLDATGKAQFTTSSLPLGVNTLTAYFGGNGTLAVGTGTVMQTITMADPTMVAIASDMANPTVGQTVTFTATVSSGVGTPTGTVNFFSNGFKLNMTSVPVDGAGKAVFAATSSATQAGSEFNPGINHITAIYTPTGTFGASTGEVAQKVQANAFGSGNILVYRTGDGTNTLTPNGNRIYIDEYLPGTLNQSSPIQSIILPTIAEGANLPVLGSGQQSAEGQITLSPDGKYAYFPAYNALPTNVVSLTFTDANTIPRVVGRINLATREIETSLALTNVASSGVFRGVTVAADGSIYVSGSTGGVSYIPDYVSGATPIANSSLNWSGLQIFGTTPQLYGAVFTNGSGEKLETIGNGLPTFGTPVTPFPGIPVLPDGTLPVAPVDFYLADLSPTVEVTAGAGVDTLYISDNGPSFNAGTITKWSWDPNLFTWVLNSNGPIPPASPDASSPILPSGTTTNLDSTFLWMQGTTDGTSVKLLITNGAGGTNTGGGTVWSITDTAGYNAAFSTTTLDTIAQTAIGTRKAFRGVVQLPGSAAPVVDNFTVNNGDVQRSRLTTVTVNFGSAVDAAQFQAAGAISFTQYAGPAIGTVVDVTNGLIVSPAAGSVSSLTLTFNGALNTTGVNFGSLADGRWQLAVVPAAFTSPNGPSDVTLRRLFGDINNDGTVSGNPDFADFGNVFGTSPGVGVSPFDFNNDGTIDGTVDFAEFGSRFGVTL